MPLRTPAVRQQRRGQNTAGKAVENSRKLPLILGRGPADRLRSRRGGLPGAGVGNHAEIQPNELNSNSSHVFGDVCICAARP